jgi:antirestriction protein ArdC
MTTKKTAAEVIVSRVLEAIEAKQKLPWQKPWRSTAFHPRNFATKRNYSGMNIFLTMFLGESASNQYLTFKQAQELGGNIKKGAKSLPIGFFSQIKSKETNSKGEHSFFPMLRYFNVFAVEDTEGIETGIDAPMEIRKDILSCQSIVDGFTNAPMVINGDHAAYNPKLDQVEMPMRGLFKSDQEWYSTLFHELAHSTGHEKRLNRKGITETIGKTRADYSREELIAEISACSLMDQAGQLEAVANNSVSYLQGWIKWLKDNPTELLKAMTQAGKATNLILGIKEVAHIEPTTETVTSEQIAA